MVLHRVEQGHMVYCEAAKRGSTKGSEGRAPPRVVAPMDVKRRKKKLTSGTGVSWPHGSGLA
jgi:hypothetical protein